MTAFLVSTPTVEDWNIALMYLRSLGIWWAGGNQIQPIPYGKRTKLFVQNDKGSKYVLRYGSSGSREEETMLLSVNELVKLATPYFSNTPSTRELQEFLSEVTLFCKFIRVGL